MTQAVWGVKTRGSNGSGLPGRTGPVMKPFRRGARPGDRVALALAVPTIKPGGNISGLKLNAYADARRASFGFVKESAGDGRTRSGPGWHCTPAGLIVSGGERSCGKATCRFCWARAVGTLLNGVHARREACAAAGVPFEVRLWRDDFPLSRDEYSVRFNTFCAERSELKKAVDSRKAGTPAGGWRGMLLLPHPADLSPRPPSRVGGLPSDGVLTEFSVAVYEGPAVRRLGSGRPGSREMAIPGELLDECLTANGKLVEFFAPPHDPAALPAGESGHVRDFLANRKRVTAYGTLRKKRWGESIDGNSPDDAAEVRKSDGGGKPAGAAQRADRAGRPSRRPPPMAPLPTPRRLPEKPR